MSGMSITTVPDDGAGLVVSASAWMTHRCPHREEVDEGHVIITWRVTDRTLELHDLAKYLTEWADEPVSHERLTDQILRDVEAAGVQPVAVVSTWRTAGMDVTVRRAGDGET